MPVGIGLKAFQRQRAFGGAARQLGVQQVTLGLGGAPALFLALVQLHLQRTLLGDQAGQLGRLPQGCLQLDAQGLLALAFLLAEILRVLDGQQQAAAGAQQGDCQQ